MIDGRTIPVLCHGLGSLYVSTADDDDDADERTRIRDQRRGSTTASIDLTSKTAVGAQADISGLGSNEETRRDETSLSGPRAPDESGK